MNVHYSLWDLCCRLARTAKARLTAALFILSLIITPFAQATYEDAIRVMSGANGLPNYLLGEQLLRECAWLDDDVECQLALGRLYRLGVFPGGTKATAMKTGDRRTLLVESLVWYYLAVNNKNSNQAFSTSLDSLSLGSHSAANPANAHARFVSRARMECNELIDKKYEEVPVDEAFERAARKRLHYIYQSRGASGLIQLGEIYSREFVRQNKGRKKYNEGLNSGQQDWEVGEDDEDCCDVIRSIVEWLTRQPTKPEPEEPPAPPRPPYDRSANLPNDLCKRVIRSDLLKTESKSKTESESKIESESNIESESEAKKTTWPPTKAPTEEQSLSDAFQYFYEAAQSGDADAARIVALIEAQYAGSLTSVSYSPPPNFRQQWLYDGFNFHDVHVLTDVSAVLHQDELFVNFLSMWKPKDRLEVVAASLSHLFPKTLRGTGALKVPVKGKKLTAAIEMFQMRIGATQTGNLSPWQEVLIVKAAAKVPTSAAPPQPPVPPVVAPPPGSPPTPPTVGPPPRTRKPLPQRADPTASYFLGAMFQHGGGVYENFDIALSLYEQSAKDPKRPDPRALCKLYWFYVDNRFLPRDLVKSEFYKNKIHHMPKSQKTKMQDVTCMAF